MTQKGEVRIFSAPDYPEWSKLGYSAVPAEPEIGQGNSAVSLTTYAIYSADGAAEVCSQIRRILRAAGVPVETVQGNEFQCIRPEALLEVLDAVARLQGNPEGIEKKYAN